MLEREHSAWLMKLQLVLGVQLLACIIFVVLVEVDDHQGNIILAVVVVQTLVGDDLSDLLKRQALTAEGADHSADFFFGEAKVETVS